MNQVIKVISNIPKLETKKKVAAYARVSSGKDAMLHSLSQQISYYSELIQSNTQWQYAGVYIDEALSGTKERPEFLKMISDAKNGKIDLIITKSISRFARNTVTLLTVARELKEIGVDIFFEEQNLHSLSGDGELMITILVSYAQEESRQVSENLKWRIKKNFEEGIPWGFVTYGYRFRFDKIEVVEEEAKLVKLMFELYLNGSGYDKIAKKLNELGYKNRKGNNWTRSSVYTIINNQDYTGDLVLQKTYIDNHINKKWAINNGVYNKYLVENSHEAIIPKEVYNEYLKELKKRQIKINIKKSTNQVYPFTKLLVCDKCGSHFHRKIGQYKNSWKCSTYLQKGVKFCNNKQVPEEVLYDLTKMILNKKTITREELIEKIQKIVVCENNIIKYVLQNGEEKEVKWMYKSRSETWTQEKRELAGKKSKERNQGKCKK